MSGFPVFLEFQKARSVSGLLLVCLVALSAAPVHAQSGRDLENRLNRLENEIQTLSRSVYRGEMPTEEAFSGGMGDLRAQADAQVRVQQLEMDLRALGGKLEEQAFEIRQMRQQLERFTNDVSMRLDEQTAFAPQGEPPAVQPGAGDFSQGYQWSSNPSVATPAQAGLGGVSGGVAERYEAAFSLLKNAQYDQAQAAFTAFLQDNPDHVLSGNAKYWLGETYYVRKDFETAARIFAEGFQQYPKGAKAADNLLKLGMSLSSLGNKGDACTALMQIEKEFPVGAGPVIRRAEQEISRLSCGG